MPGLLDVDGTFTCTSISRTVALRCDALALAVDPSRAIGVNMVYNYVTAEIVPRMKDADKPVWRWAVNTERSSLSLARMGVASITVAILIGYLRPLQDGKHQTRGLHARLSEPKSTLPSPF
jgi:hypothetical protein